MKSITGNVKKYKKHLLLVCFFFVLGMFYSLHTNAAIRSIVDDKQSDKEVVDNKSCWAKGYRKTCPAGLEGADSCTQNGKTYYKACGKCETDGYFKSCPADQVKGSKLACNAEYSKCECKPEYKYGSDRKKCDLVLGGNKCTSDGKDYYSQCSCDAKYKYSCNATGLKGGTSSCGEGSSKKYETCVCSEKSIVENGYTCDQVQSEGFTCYINCKLAPVKTCESITGNYVTTCPAGQEGTSVTVDGMSCKKDCKAKTIEEKCFEAGYKIKGLNCGTTPRYMENVACPFNGTLYTDKFSRCDETCASQINKANPLYAVDETSFIYAHGGDGRERVVVLTKDHSFARNTWPGGNIFIPGTRFTHLPLCKNLKRPKITLTDSPTDGFAANKIEDMDFIFKFKTYFKGYLGPSGNPYIIDSFTYPTRCPKQNTIGGTYLKNVNINGHLDLNSGNGAFGRRMVIFNGNNSVTDMTVSGGASAQNSSYGCPFGAVMVNAGAKLTIKNSATVHRKNQLGFCTINGTVVGTIKDSDGSYPCNR